METSVAISNVEPLETLDLPVDSDAEVMKQRSGKVSSSSSSSSSQQQQDDDVAKPLMGSSRTTKRLAYALAVAMLLVTFYSFPMHHHFHGRGGKNARYVWWCGWLTAIATGIGALPFYWIRDLDKYWLGICNGLAAGMMIAATGCLFYEGWYLPQAADYAVSVSYRLLLGAFLGGLDARKALLIMAVMTLHSVSEGIGVGVSFGGEGGIRRGHIVTMTMAIHNIPEGVAISLSLVPRGLSVFYAVLWCIMSSAPQPIFAVPAFLFVEQWLPILPCGLGFAGGAMAYVAVQELLPESLEDTKSVPTTVSATAFAFMVFLTIQIALSGSI
ncbi:Zinc (Zn2)-Iron (Fe2) Permease (ZIP) Family [Phytophthora cinnamomi]|uniref:Zinc (Zn2)-Iron (Fe2) Permease (ZIP) Family n=1 Tax=Phytophthora cinnamomi TaxID=4785 RepID=UPI00355ACB96|nr:Zinc (Zn2)-Iron (Fe2) Permease (ZIP) Family [Phytophthora cinnamomi]